MKNSLIFFLMLNFFTCFVQCFRKVGLINDLKNETDSTKQVVIGIVDSPLTRFLKNKNFNKNDTMIPSSYVKFIEQTDAKIIRIPYYASYEKLDSYLQNINGLLLTGGSQLVRKEKTNELSNYAKKIKYLLNQIIKINEKGQNFPVYGICNGFSQMVCSFSTDINNFDKDQNICNVLIQLQHKQERKRIKLIEPLIEPFSSMKENLINNIEEEDQLVFYHSLYLKPNKFKNNKHLNNNFNISSIYQDNKNQTFISSMHHKQYPIFADIFHPEKSVFEWKSQNIGHKFETMLFGYNIADYLFQEASKNNHITSEEYLNQILDTDKQTNLVETPKLAYESIYVFKYDESYL